MRDTHRDCTFFSEQIDQIEEDLLGVFVAAEGAIDARRRAGWLHESYFVPMLELLALRYSRGDALEELEALLPRMLDALAVVTEAYRQDRAHFPDDPVNLRYGGPFRDALVLLGYVACLSPDERLLQRLLEMIGPGNAVFDGLAARFEPARPQTDNLAGKYEQKWFLQCWGGLGELLQAPEHLRSGAMQTYMKRWYGRMRIFPWWNSHQKWHYKGYWCLEAAVAVAGLDIDDCKFRDHPYYPVDLVDHYRSKVRRTRDAWRVALPVSADR
jgi:hypothetical protein